jgi:hypothetical protein
MRQKRSLLVFVLIAMGIAVFIHYVRANSSDISDKLSFAAQDRNYPLHAPGCNCTEIREGEGPPRWCSSRRAREEHRARAWSTCRNTTIVSTTVCLRGLLVGSQFSS